MSGHGLGTGGFFGLTMSELAQNAKKNGTQITGPDKI